MSRTVIKRRTLNPVWNEDFRLEISNDSGSILLVLYVIYLTLDRLAE